MRRAPFCVMESVRCEGGIYRAGIKPIGTTTRKVKGKKITQNVYYGFHEIRHFIATYLHDIEKQPTGVIGNILGHKSKRTTEIYLHPVDEAAKIAMLKLEGIFVLDDLPDVPKNPKPHTVPTHQTKLKWSKLNRGDRI